MPQSVRKEWKQVNVLKLDFHGKNENIFLTEDANQSILYEGGNPASSLSGYKHSVAESFTTKSKVTSEHTLKELSQVTQE